MCSPTSVSMPDFLEAAEEVSESHEGPTKKSGVDLTPKEDGSFKLSATPTTDHEAPVYLKNKSSSHFALSAVYGIGFVVWLQAFLKVCNHIVEVRHQNMAARVHRQPDSVHEVVSDILNNKKISYNAINRLNLYQQPDYEPAPPTPPAGNIDHQQEEIGQVEVAQRHSDREIQDQLYQRPDLGNTIVTEDPNVGSSSGSVTSTNMDMVTYFPAGDQEAFFRESARVRRKLAAELEVESRGKGKEICEDEPFQPEQDQGFSMSQSFYNLPATLQTQAAQAQMSRESAGETSSSAQNEPLTEGTSTSTGQKPKPKGKKKKNKGHGRRP